MGVPVVSLVGRGHRSRVGKSLLTSAGRSELAAVDPAGFALAATTLAERARARGSDVLRQDSTSDATRWVEQVARLLASGGSTSAI